MRPPERTLLLTLALLSLATTLSSQAAVKLTSPAGFVPGVPFLVRVEALTSTGTPDVDLWDAEAVLSVDQPGVTLSTNRVQLRNGVGTALLVIQGSSGFNLKAAVGSQEATRLVSSLAAI